MKNALALLAPVLLVGCLADYTLPSALDSARIKVVRKATPMICAGERPERLVPDRDGYARVPAERPITLVAQFEGHDFVCMPALTFTPAAGASYVHEFEVVSRACSTTLQVETPRGPQAAAHSDSGSFGCRGRP